MKEVSYEKFQKIVKIFCFFSDLCYKYPFLKHFIPKKWYDIYTCPYYYLVTDENCPRRFRKYLVYLGKAVDYEFWNEGFLTGIAVTMEDMYYIILDNKGKEHWCSCVGRLVEL